MNTPYPRTPLRNELLKTYLLFLLTILINGFTKAEAAMPAWADKPGVVIVTCGVLDNSVPAYASAPQYTVGMMDTRNPGAFGNYMPVADYHDATWTVGQLGNVFGVTQDATGNFYVTASSSFSGSNGFVPFKKSYGSIGGYNAASPSSVASLEAAGTVYKIDKVTGVPTVFAKLPQQYGTAVDYDGATISYAPGLGNIAYDYARNQFFVTNFENGKIHRISSTGALLSTYDPFTADSGALGFAPLGERVWAVAVYRDRVFFSVWAKDSHRTSNPSTNSIYSVGLNGSGDFDTASFAFEVSPPNLAGKSFNNPVADISFSATGEMLVSQRTMKYDLGALNHDSEVFLYGKSQPGTYAAGGWSLLRNVKTGYADGMEAYGGADFGHQAVNTSTGAITGYQQVIWRSSADTLNALGPHGMQGTPRSYLSNPDGNSWAIDYDGDATLDAKGQGADVHVVRNYATSSVGSLVWGDLDADGLVDAGETGLANISIEVYRDTVPDGFLDTTADLRVATMVTDFSGAYRFADLAAGSYFVSIPPGAVSLPSSGNTDTADNQQDDDDNGIQTSGAGTRIESPLITLAATGEPTSAETGVGGERDNGNDAAGDMTVDFGIACPTITLSPVASTLTAGTAYVAYSTSITAAGGTAPYQYYVASGILPSGLILLQDGTLSGTPTLAGTYNFTVAVVDASGCSANKAFSLSIGCSTTASITPTTLANPQTGVAYSVDLNVLEGSASSWVINSGALPAGLTLSSSSGLISGIPAAIGTFTFEVKATGSDGCVTLRSYTITTACSTGSISPQTTLTSTVDAAFSQALTVTNTVGSVAWTVSSGTLLAGVTLNASTGVLSGSPSAAGNFNFNITATDSLGCTRVRNYTMTVNCSSAVTVSPTSVASAPVGSAITPIVFSASGAGATSFTYSQSGTLPTGLSFNAATATLSGTPTVGGSYTFTIHALGDNACPGSRTYTMTITCGVTLSVSPTGSTLPNGNTGNAYSQTFTASGGAGGYTFAITSGALPSGLSLSAGGLLSGTIGASASGTYTFTVRAQDSNGCVGSRSYTLLVTGCSPITVSPTSLSGLATGNSFSQTLSASGGTSPYTFAVTAGTLPAGLSLDSSSGLISGTPSTNGAYSFSVTATDSASCTGVRTYSGTVACGSVPVPLPSSLPAATLSTAYSQTLSSSGGTGPYTYAVSVGTLPTGLTLSTAGVLSGTPTAAGSTTVTIRSTDANGCQGTRSYIIVVNCGAGYAITPSTLPNPSIGVAYSQDLTLTGGTGTEAWNVQSGSLPAGLTLNATTGLISGTPTTSGTYNFTIRGRYTATNCSATQSYTLVAGCSSSLVVSPATPVNGTVGTAYTQTMSVSGGTSPIVWSVTSGSLPPGLTLNSSTGVVSGTPSAAGAYTVTIRAVDANGCVGTISVIFSIGCGSGGSGMTLNYPTLSTDFYLGLSSSAMPAVTNAASPYSFSITSGALPSGISLNTSTGEISGTAILPVVSPWSATIRIVGNDGCVATKSLTGNVTCPVGWAINTSPAPANMVAGLSYSHQFTVTSGNGSAVTWSATGLPSGLTLNSTTGLLSGTPAQTGTFSMVITATDAYGCAATYSFSKTIACPTTINRWSIVATPTTGVTSNGFYYFLTLGVPASINFTTTAGAAPIVWTVTGTIPGMSFNTSTGILSGTPTTYDMVSPAPNITVTATDAAGCSRTLTWAAYVDCPGVDMTMSPASVPAMTKGTFYSIQFTGSGGTAPYTYTLGGTIPAGMTFNSSTGLLSGTPTATGTFNFNVRGDDVYSLGINDYYTDCYALISGTITVTCPTAPAMVLNTSPSTPPSAYLNVPYGPVTLSATGGVPPYTYSISSGTLPAGLTFNASTGVISGTPTALVATNNVTFRVDDSVGCYSATKVVNLAVTCQGGNVTLPSATLPTSYNGTPYSYSFSATGGTAPYSFTLNSGTLPPGLTLNTNGTLSGTPAGIQSAYSFTIRATDANGCSGTRAYSISNCLALISVTPNPLPNASVGVPYSQVMAATGGTTGYTWNGSISPAGSGLTFNNATATISGTPTTSGSYNLVLVVTSTTACAPFFVIPITVGTCPTITLNPSTLSGGTVGVAYSASVSASGGATPYVYSLSGAPAWMSINSATGAITGTPTSSGSFTFTASATDANNCAGTLTYTIDICPVISITPATLPNGVVGTAYSQSVSASGGAAPYTYTAVGLPAGLSINSTTGLISGNPTAVGTSSVTITALDVAGECSGSLTLSIGVCPSGMAITPASLSAATVGTAYSVTLTDTVPGTATWSVTSGALPSWMTLNTSTGVLSGTPNNTTATSFTITASGTGGCNANIAYTLTPTCPASMTVTPTSAGPFVVGTAITPVDFNSTNVPGTVTFSASGLPAGLSINSSTGIVSGTPTAVGTSSVTITATGTGGCNATATLSIGVCPSGMAITPATLPAATVGTAYSVTLTDNVPGTATWSVTSGALPSWMSLNTSTGVLSGTPNNTTAASFTITASGTGGCNASIAYTLTPTCPASMTVTPTSAGPFVVGTAITPVDFNATNVPGTATFSASGLPAGLSINSSTGIVSGTPTAVGTSSVTVTATGTAGCNATATMTFRICPAITVNPATLPNGNVGTPYSQAISATGGTAPYTYTVSVGSLPPGLSLNGGTGLVSGTPTAAGTSNFTISATDTSGVCAGVRSFAITISSTTDLGIGNLVYCDLDGDGLFVEGNDMPVENVIVELYTSAQTPGVSSPIATDTTDADGLYMFGNLSAGSYIVHISNVNFQLGNPLSGKLSVTGNGTDDQKDDLTDENGVDANVPLNTGVSSTIITLSVGAEPLDVNEDGWHGRDDTIDANYDLTVDFGFEVGKGTNYAQWAGLNPQLGTFVCPDDNIDKDIYRNSAEYAFCLPPHNGTGNAICLEPATLSSFFIEFHRVLGGPTDTSYFLRYITDLAASPLGWTEVSLASLGASVVITPNGDGVSETVRINNVQSLMPVGGVRIFFQIAAKMDYNGDSVRDVIDYTEVHGIQYSSAEANECETFSDPFIEKPVFNGRIDTITGMTINVGTTSGDQINFTPGFGLLDPARSYHIEIINGTYEGHRFEVLSSGLETLTIENDTNVCIGAPYGTINTSAGLPAGLAGANFILVQDRRLNEMAPISLMTATNSSTTADRILVPNSSGGWDQYWAYLNGGAPYWAKNGAGTTNQNATTFSEQQGFFFHPRTTAKTLTQYGIVRFYKFATPLCTGTQLLGLGYPMDMSPAQLGYDSITTIGTRSPLSSEKILTWNRDGTSATDTDGYCGYWFMEHDGMNKWLKIGETNLTGYDNTRILKGERAYFYKALTDHLTHVVPLPWTYPVRYTNNYCP